MSNNIGNRGSENANEWARKRKEQIDSSKRLREERKTGGSLLKNVGEQFVLKGGTQSSQSNQQNVTATSGFSAKSGTNNATHFTNNIQTASTSTSLGFNNYQKMQYNDQSSHMNSQFGQQPPIGTGFGNNMAINSKLQSNGFNSGINKSSINYSNITYDDGFRGGELPIRTQENYYNPSQRRDTNNIINQSISYEREDPANYTSFNGFKGMGGNQQQNQQAKNINRGDPRSQRKGSYSRQELEVARSNLKLLKNKMSNKQGQQRALSYAKYNGTEPSDQDADLDLSNNRVNSKHGNLPRPNRPQSSISQNLDAGSTSQYQNNNYRKAFRPGQDQADNLEQINDIVLSGNGISLPKQQQQQMKRGQASEYDPTDRQSKQPVRRIGGNGINGGNQVLDQQADMISPGGIKYQPYNKDIYQNNNSKKQQQNNFDQYNQDDSSSQQNYDQYNKSSKNEKNYNNIYENAVDDGQPEEYAGGDQDRIECATCGRKFNQEALAKHAKVCKKVFVQKRKVFDTKQQRKLDAEGGGQDDNYYKPPPSKSQPQKKQQQDEKPISSKQSKAAKWKAQSEMLRAAMQAARGAEPDGGNTGYGGVAAAKYEPQDDRTECQFCGRKFAELTAQRHIPVCEKKFKENQIKSKGAGNQRSTGIGFRR